MATVTDTDLTGIFALIVALDTYVEAAGREAEAGRAARDLAMLDAHETNGIPVITLANELGMCRAAGYKALDRARQTTRREDNGMTSTTAKAFLIRERDDYGDFESTHFWGLVIEEPGKNQDWVLLGEEEPTREEVTDALAGLGWSVKAKGQGVHANRYTLGAAN